MLRDFLYYDLLMRINFPDQNTKQAVENMLAQLDAHGNYNEN